MTDCEKKYKHLHVPQNTQIPHTLWQRHAVGSLTFQTPCTSCPGVAVCHKWWRTVIHWCWDHCLPWKLPHGHCAEQEEKPQHEYTSVKPGLACAKCSTTENSSSILLLRTNLGCQYIPSQSVRSSSKWLLQWKITSLPSVHEKRCQKLVLLLFSVIKTLKPNLPSTEMPVPMLIISYCSPTCRENSDENISAYWEHRNTFRYSLNSSSNFLPQMLLPPFPVPDKEAPQ